MKAALTIASLALVLTGVSGCGDDGPPTDASADDFCENFSALGEEFLALGEDPDDADVIKTVKSLADDMAETGTPEDIPDDARAGFEVGVEAIQDLDDDASIEDFDTLDEEFSDEDQENSDAFDTYLEETCGTE